MFAVDGRVAGLGMATDMVTVMEMEMEMETAVIIVNMVVKSCWHIVMAIGFLPCMRSYRWVIQFWETFYGSRHLPVQTIMVPCPFCLLRRLMEIEIKS